MSEMRLLHTFKEDKKIALVYLSDNTEYKYLTMFFENEQYSYEHWFSKEQEAEDAAEEFVLK